MGTALSHKQVLVVDDSRTVRAFLRRALESQGAQVSEVSSGKEALDAAAVQPFDLVLLDLVLPDIDGIEVLGRLREKGEKAAIVLLTGMGDVKTATEAVRRGADGYITKQDIQPTGDLSGFYYALEQALEHRAGILAQEQLQQVKADFYAMVTHDLRNPTGAILSILDMLLEESEALDPSHVELLTLARDAATQLLELINNYLDYSKIEAGYLKLNRAPVDLRQVVESCRPLAMNQARVRNQQLTFEMPAQPVVAYADAERLKQVCDNLLSNAFKYTPEGGSIHVKLGIENGWAVLQVRDNGRGIPPEQLPALFTKYHRVPGEATRGIRGTGLGLLIVKEVVEAHGGSVGAESSGIPGEGSTFTVKLPLAAGAA